MGWCMGQCMGWCGGGVLNVVLYYLDWGWGRRIDEVGPGHWGSPGLVMMR